MRLFDYSAKRAVPINLVTIVAALATRITMASVEPILPLVPLLLLFTGASMAGAYLGTGYVHRLHESSFEKMVATLLIWIGMVLVAESFLGLATRRAAEGMFVNVCLAIGLGGIIGLISSLLGVAGGELIIPARILVFGVGVKEDGTASLLISSATILVGFSRTARKDAIVTVLT